MSGRCAFANFLPNNIVRRRESSANVELEFTAIFKREHAMALRIENLESRIALDASRIFSFAPTDVNGDGFTTPLDALLVINEIGNPTGDCSRLDVNFDGVIAPLDALAVINNLAEFEDVRQELVDARTRWEEQEIESYEMTYNVIVSAPALPVTVIVEDGAVISATNMNGELDTTGVHTVDSLFERIDNAIRRPAASLSAEFDPETGRPIRVFINPSDFITDIDSTVRVTEFKVR